MRLAIRAVCTRLEEREQSEIVERAESQLGIERCRGARETGAGQRGVARGERRGPGVVPRRVVILPLLQLGEVCGGGAAGVALIPCLLGGGAWTGGGGAF